MTNRDKPATLLTKREHAALAVLNVLIQNNVIDTSVGMTAVDAIAFADALFDQLDTPAELRDEPLWGPEDHP